MRGDSRWRHASLVIEVLLFGGLLGLPDGALGVLWPSLRAEFGRPVGDLGTLVLAGVLPYLVGSSATGVALRRLGTARVIGWATTLAVAALASWLLAPTWGLVVGAAGLLGLARGAVDGGINAHVAVTSGVTRLGLLHASYGAGATVGPLVAAPLVVAGPGWRAVIALLAAVAAAAAIAARHLDAGWDTPTHSVADDHAPIRATSTVRRSRLVLPGTLLLFFTYTSVEVAAGIWAYTFLTEARGLSGVAAGVVSAGYWGGLTGGRIGVALLGGRVSGHRLLHVSVTLTLAGFVVVWANPARLGAVGLPLAGIGLAAIFPLLIALTPERLGPGRAPAAIGWSVAAAAVGGTVFTWAVGQIAERRGLGSIPPVITGAALALGALHLAVDRLTARRHAGETGPA